MCKVQWKLKIKKLKTVFFELVTSHATVAKNDNHNIVIDNRFCAELIICVTGLVLHLYDCFPYRYDK